MRLKKSHWQKDRKLWMFSMKDFEEPKVQVSEYEWRSMADWLKENRGRSIKPEDEGWELVGGALRRRRLRKPDEKTS